MLFKRPQKIYCSRLMLVMAICFGSAMMAYLLYDLATELGPAHWVNEFLQSLEGNKRPASIFRYERSSSAFVVAITSLISGFAGLSFGAWLEKRWGTGLYGAEVMAYNRQVDAVRCRILELTPVVILRHYLDRLFLPGHFFGRIGIAVFTRNHLFLLFKEKIHLPHPIVPISELSREDLNLMSHILLTEWRYAVCIPRTEILKIGNSSWKALVASIFVLKYWLSRNDGFTFSQVHSFKTTKGTYVVRSNFENDTNLVDDLLYLGWKNEGLPLAQTTEAVKPDRSV